MKLFIMMFLSLFTLFHSSSMWATSRRELLSRALEQQIGIAYHFGGDNPDTGFDCSGLVEYAYAKIGQKLPHSTKALQHVGKKVALSNLRAGDLIFFSPGGRVSHVGVYLGDGVVVHAPSTGKNVTVMDVFHHIYWKKVIAFARRVVPNL